MLKRTGIAALLVLACCALVSAAQLQALKIVPDPNAAGMKPADGVIRVEWIQLEGAGSQVPVDTEAMYNAEVYFARNPGGGDLSRYTRLAAVRRSGNSTIGGGAVATKFIEFVPSAQRGTMRPGTYYGIVAAVTENDTVYSDYFNIMVESHVAPTAIQPKADLRLGQTVATIHDLTPLFRWSPGDIGVPYYHILLSDVPIVDSDGNPNSDLNVIWQAITPNTSIAYGAPDPSGTITASPPPLMPGKTYSWMVLNNYGNHMTFTSSVFNAVDLMLGQFVISGTAIDPPRITGPANGASFSHTADPSLGFRWTNLDTRANSYLVNLFSMSDADGLGIDGLGDVNAGMLIWETTVARGNLGKNDTLTVNFDAAGTLTGGDYVLRIHALDSRGAASTGDSSVVNFSYSANTGSISVTTRELIGGVVPFGIAFTELRVEVVTGPTQAPLAFFTDRSGYAGRTFPVGTYRITALKEGYSTQTATVSVRQGQTAQQVFTLTRPEAVLFGRIRAASDSSAINSARVTAISEWGDTVTTFTDGNGGYTLSCRAADWTVTTEKAGYRSAAPMRVTLRPGDNRELPAVYKVRNPHALSGVVRNEAGEPVIGVRVRILNSEGVLVDELASTPQSGAYIFDLMPGRYTLTAQKPGLVMFSRNIDVTNSHVQNITLRSGAVLVNGTVTGRAWIPDEGEAGFYREAAAPIASARARFTDKESGEAFTAVGDAVFGMFSISLPENREYEVTFEAAGFHTNGVRTDFNTDAELGATREFEHTVNAFAMIRGGVVRESGGTALDNVNIFVYDDNGLIAASGMSAVNGTYEVRNIRDGVYTVGAGRSGYYMTAPVEMFVLNVVDGRPVADDGGDLRYNYNFEMSVGQKTINWVINGYSGDGSIKVISPLNTTIPFVTDDDGNVTAELRDVGPGVYVMEAAADENRHPELLQLSRRRFTVPANEADSHTEDIRFLVRHNSPATLPKTGDGYSLSVGLVDGVDAAAVKRVQFFYRREGSTRFETRVTDPAGARSVNFQLNWDGANLRYYFEVEFENGDVYGSSKQTFTTYVTPDPAVVTSVAVTPGGTGGDTLFLPSSYEARFTFGAFYSDLFMPFGNNNSIYDAVSWNIGGTQGSGRTFAYSTPASAQDLTLIVTLGSSVSVREESLRRVEIPVRITGRALHSIHVRRQGNEGPITNTGEAGFTLDAYDAPADASNRQYVTVAPEWSIEPKDAGTITSGGVFRPRSDFIGNVRIAAAVGGLRTEYVTSQETAGQDVRYILRHRASGSDTVSTLRGLRLVFPANSVAAGENIEFGVSSLEMDNHVHRGSDEFRMADTLAFDIESSAHQRITDDGGIVIMFNIPEHLRDALRSGDQQFLVARWSSVDLKWIPLANSGITSDHTAAYAKLTNEPQPAALSRRSDVMTGEAASTLAASARYALVTKTYKLSVTMSVSPHPFSPYIRPVREHGPDAPEGTCVTVTVEAPEAFVKSIKVHIYNATGTRVWAVDKLNAEAGINRFWWNGRTSGGSGRTAVSEEMWTEDYHIRTRSRPMARNGRYFVVVVVTDNDGKQVRLRRPVVLMK